jgi:hypothetical protein
MPISTRCQKEYITWWSVLFVEETRVYIRQLVTVLFVEETRVYI